jgi:RNA polymerase sigma-70 factor, ECF subfamily
VGELDAYRSYLTILAEGQIGPRLRSKLDPTDVVQQTLLKALQHLEKFRGEGGQEFRAWLRSILANTITDYLRKFGEARGGGREQSLEAALQKSSINLDGLLRDHGSTPSHRASRKEQALLLADALGRLPEEQRIAVVLRHLHDKSLPEIAEEMDRSIPSVAGLLRRGLKSLRLELELLS